ncbi:hypothetical protein [Streptomyces sp. NPDC059247]|uniref:hypothetical protein n=1 Tax=Streptomyces sp. NPDC059247 TaxID=3346790 RepID=UPI0036B3A504
MSTPIPPTATRVRKGAFSLQADSAPTPTPFSCQPTAVALSPEAGDKGDAVEVLCGQVIDGEVSPTKWTMKLTSIQSIEAEDDVKTSLVMYALVHDGETVTFVVQPSPTAKAWTGRVTVIALAIGGEVGGTPPVSEAEWPMVGPPVEKTDEAPAADKTPAVKATPSGPGA